MGPLTRKVCEELGYPVTEDGKLEMLQFAVHNDCPGICKECKAVYEYVEPDARDNYCEVCGRTKVVSVLILNSLI